jgi:hypothetical protein
MTPMLGIMASSGNKYVSTYTQIAQVGYGPGSSITFSSIPQTYKHLIIRNWGRAVGSGSSFTNLQITFNGVSTSSYSYENMEYSNGTAGGSIVSSTYILAGYQANQDLVTNRYSMHIMEFPEYSDSIKLKTANTISHVAGNANPAIYTNYVSGVWNSTAPITSITLTISAGNFNGLGTMFLYGVN